MFSRLRVAMEILGGACIDCGASRVALFDTMLEENIVRHQQKSYAHKATAMRDYYVLWHYHIVY